MWHGINQHIAADSLVTLHYTNNTVCTGMGDHLLMGNTPPSICKQLRPTQPPILKEIRLIDRVKVLCHNWHKIGYFGDVLLSQSLGLVLKKEIKTKTKAKHVSTRKYTITKQTKKPGLAVSYDLCLKNRMGLISKKKISKEVIAAAAVAAAAAAAATTTTPV